MTTWVIGHGGLLGSAIARSVRGEGGHGELFTSTGIPWVDPRAAADRLCEDYLQFRGRAGTGPWRIFWAAGAATVSTAPDAAAAEMKPLEALLAAIRSEPPPGSGAFFLTSSAGGVFAGASNPPFGEQSTPVPISAYGDLKLAQEEATASHLESICPVTIGRFSNLYGPGQNLAKLQGLISRLALAGISQQPISIFVPLDTIRDYIYVDDAAAVAVDLTASAMEKGVDNLQLAIIASGQPATVGQVIHTMGQVARRRIPVAYGSHPSAEAQALDLRLSPSHGVVATTQLPVGMKAAYQDILTRVQAKSGPAYQS